MPVIRVDDEVYEWLRSMAKPFDDTPNSVLRRLAGLEQSEGEPAIKQGSSTRRVNGRRERGLKTQQASFRKHLLAVLRTLGGVGSRELVLKKLEEHLGHELTSYDREKLPADGSIRWQKSTEWEVRQMRQDGLLEPVATSGRGTWQLSAEGRRLAEDQRKVYRAFRAKIAGD